MVERIGASYSLKSGVLFVSDGALSNGVLTLSDESALQGNVVVLASKTGLIGRSFIPYELSGTYLDPLLEVGDTFSVTRKGETILLIAASISIRCNPSFVCDLQNGVADDDEDEVPYVGAAELQAMRYVSTGKSYFGNRINRKEGFVSELLHDGAATARLIANATTFSMQRYHDGAWQDCIYFDAVEQKYRLTGDVTVEGAITSVDLATSGKTVINGDNITTGTLNAQLVKSAGHGISTGTMTTSTSLTRPVTSGRSASVHSTEQTLVSASQRTAASHGLPPLISTVCTLTNRTNTPA